MNHPDSVDFPSPAAPLRPRRAPRLWTGAAVVATAAVVLAVAASRGDGASDRTAPAAPPLRQLELVHAERFALDAPYAHLWRADRPQVRDGWLLVLRGDAAWMQPQQLQEPVLQVGAETAERINTGKGSGHVIALVPGDVRLADAPIFYAEAALPEELHQSDLDRSLATARASGAVPPSAAAIEAAVGAAGGEGARYADDFELRLRAIDLVERYAPDEKELIAGWRVPRVR
ncbi:MAG: hypothetical protein AB7O97_13775 [Planctomycetota bacterium]